MREGLTCIVFFILLILLDVSSFVSRNQYGGIVNRRVYRNSPNSAEEPGTGGNVVVKQEYWEEEEEKHIYPEMDPSFASFVRIKENKNGNGNNDKKQLDFTNFGGMMGHIAPYIAQHRGKIMVVHIAGYILQNKVYFDAVMDDVSILKLLGVKIVLVVGVREQLDRRIRKEGKEPEYYNGMRTTDAATMQMLKEESGAARFEIESSLARGFSGMASQSGINVVSGNSFYTAKPLGVRNGVDYQYTGEVRKIQVENFQKRLDDGDVVMITSLGYSSSGEVFNVASETLAATCAIVLKASKVLFITRGETLVDIRTDQQVKNLRKAQGLQFLSNLAVPTDTFIYDEGDDEDEYDDDVTDDSGSDASSEVDDSDMRSSSGSDGADLVDMSIADATGVSGETATAAGASRGGAEKGSSSNNKTKQYLNSGYIRLMAKCLYAVTGGVSRAHLISPEKGALLKELYTRDGEGLLISGDTYEGIRRAAESDLRGVQEIIAPLVEEGILVHRSDQHLLRELKHCFVMTRDDSVLACGTLKRYGKEHAEIGMLCVQQTQRRSGKGEVLLAYLERRALLMGVKKVFLLSTRTMQWFEERGFVVASPSDLPPSREYDVSRKSKVYMKELGTHRDIDSEELLWNI